MQFYDKDNNPITATKHYWHGGFFGDMAKQSFFVEVFGSYFQDQKVCLIIGDNFDAGPSIYDNKVVLVNNSDHHYQQEFVDDRYITLSSGFNFDSNAFYFPYWLFFSRLAQRDEDGQLDFQDRRRYSVSCMNQNIRIQRVYNLVNLYDRPYAQELCCSLARLENNFQNIVLTMDYNDEFENIENTSSAKAIFYKVVKYHGVDFLEKFKRIADSIPNVRARDIFAKSEYYHCARINEPGWIDSYLNLVTEPRIDDTGFVSEKVFKPIRAEQLFIIQGCPGTVEYLRSIGFDTFDDYIDHDRYDKEPDWIKRIDMSLSVLDGIYKDIPAIFAATKKRRQRNRQYLASQELNDLLLKDILKSLETKFEKIKNG